MVAPAVAAAAPAVIKTVGSIASSILPSLFGGSASAKASARQYAYNMALQQQAQRWNEYMYKHRYQFQVQDLEAAGINKLYGLGQAPSVTSGQGSVGMADDVGEKQNKIQNIMNTIAMAQDWSAKKAQISKMEQETNTEKINTKLKSLEMITQCLENIRRQKDLDNYDKQFEINLKKTESEIIKNLSGANKDYADAGTARALTNKTNKEAEILQPTMTNAQNMEKFLKKHPKVAGVIAGAESMKTIFQGLAAGGGLILGGKVAAARNIANIAKAAARR